MAVTISGSGTSGTFAAVATPSLDSGSATDLLLKRNGTTQVTVGATALTLGSGVTSISGGTNPSLNIGTGTLTAGLVNSKRTSSLAFLADGATTSETYGAFVNTGGGLYYGVESSAGGVILGGTSAYASVIGTYNNTPVQICTNNAVRGTFSSTGLSLGSLALTAGSGTFSGNVSVTKATGVPIVSVVASTGTNEAYFTAVNTGGSYYFGVENSAGSWFGGSAYAGVVSVPSGKTFEVIGAGTKFATFSSTGLAVTGALSCTGALSKGSGSFRIDHPMKPETHQLVHSFIEGPQADLIYRGKVNLVDGSAQINIDTAAGMTEGTFVALCREVQVFTTNESGWNHVRGSVVGNTLTIECQDQTATDLISWMVIGERKDQHMYETDWTDENGKVIVEPVKPLESRLAALEGA